MKALIYSKTAAEIQWERTLAEEVEISYNGSVIAVLDSDSYSTDQLDPSVTHRFELRSIGADGLFSKPKEITFTFGSEVRSLLVHEGLDQNPIAAAESSTQPALSEVRLLAYSNSAAELFWTRLESSFSYVEVIHNGSSLGITNSTSFFLAELDSARSHHFQVRPLRENGIHHEWYSVSVDMRHHAGVVRDIVATRFE